MEERYGVGQSSRKSRGVGFTRSGNGKYSERSGDRIHEGGDEGRVRENKFGNAEHLACISSFNPHLTP